MRNRILELMWGTSDEAVIASYKKARKKPLLTEEAATLAVRAARKDVIDVNASGGGDFTKATLVRAEIMKRNRK